MHHRSIAFTWHQYQIISKARKQLYNKLTTLLIIDSLCCICIIHIILYYNRYLSLSNWYIFIYKHICMHFWSIIRYFVALFKHLIIDNFLRLYFISFCWLLWILNNQKSSIESNASRKRTKNNGGNGEAIQQKSNLKKTHRSLTLNYKHINSYIFICTYINI